MSSFLLFYAKPRGSSWKSNKEKEIEFYVLKWQSTRGRRNEQAILARQRDASVPEKATPSLMFGFSFEGYRLEAEGVVKALCRLIFSWLLTIFFFITKQRKSEPV